jgi:hypothetical protein
MIVGAVDQETANAGGGAKPTDTRLDSIVHCVNGEIVAWLEQREQHRDEDNGDATR